MLNPKDREAVDAFFQTVYQTLETHKFSLAGGFFFQVRLSLPHVCLIGAACYERVHQAGTPFSILHQRSIRYTIITQLFPVLAQLIPDDLYERLTGDDWDPYEVDADGFPTLYDALIHGFDQDPNFKRIQALETILSDYLKERPNEQA